MTAKEVLEYVIHFIDNDFKHLRAKVDKLFLVIIGGLLSIVGGLIYLIVK